MPSSVLVALAVNTMALLSGSLFAGIPVCSVDGKLDMMCTAMSWLPRYHYVNWREDASVDEMANALSDARGGGAPVLASFTLDSWYPPYIYAQPSRMIVYQVHANPFASAGCFCYTVVTPAKVWLRAVCCISCAVWRVTCAVGMSRCQPGRDPGNGDVPSFPIVLEVHEVPVAQVMHRRAHMM